MSKREGPRVTLKASCDGCRHNENEDYVCQSDSGWRVFCAHPDIVDQSAIRSRRRIGDTTWDTPKWCPLLAAAIANHDENREQE